MKTPTKAPRPGGPPALPNRPECKPNWKVLVPVVLISAVVLLVCLPVGALLIVNNTGCCLANSPENVITFWASMIAGFLALFAMIITGVFIITAFRVEATARAEAQIAAGEEVWKYIENYREKLYADLRELADLAPKVINTSQDAMQAMARAQEDVEARQHEAINAIAQAQSETASAADEAQRTIGGKQEETIDAARQAQEAIGGAVDETTRLVGEAQRTIGEARDQTTNAANEAQGVIVGARQDVERQRTDAISAIDSAREEVEAAAQAARDRLDRAGDAPQGEDDSD